MTQPSVSHLSFFQSQKVSTRFRPPRRKILGCRAYSGEGNRETDLVEVLPAGGALRDVEFERNVHLGVQGAFEVFGDEFHEAMTLCRVRPACCRSRRLSVVGEQIGSGQVGERLLVGAYLM